MYDELHKVLMQELLQRIKEGRATSADLSVARQFLKDNNIEATKENNKELGDISNLLKGIPKWED